MRDLDKYKIEFLERIAGSSYELIIIQAISNFVKYIHDTEITEDEEE